MATATETRLNESVSLAQVFQLALLTIRHNPVVTLSLAFLFGAVPALFVNYAVSTLTDDATGSGDAILWALYVFSLFANLVVSALTQAFQTRATVTEAEGRRATLAECVRAGLSVLVPLVLLSVLISLAITLGYVLLLVPGLALGALWSVAVPALVEERNGVLASLRRSRILTQGAWSRIFGLMLVLLAISILVMVIVEVGSGEWGSESLAAAYSNPAYLLLSITTSTLLNVFWGAVQASLYVELKEWKDGPTAHRLEQIFS